MKRGRRKKSETSGSCSWPNISGEHSIWSYQVQHWWHQIGPQIPTHISKMAVTQGLTWMTSLPGRKYNIVCLISWKSDDYSSSPDLWTCWAGHREGGGGSLSWRDMLFQWLVVPKQKVAEDELFSCLAVWKPIWISLLICSFSWFAKVWWCCVSWDDSLLVFHCVEQMS